VDELTSFSHKLLVSVLGNLRKRGPVERAEEAPAAERAEEEPAAGRARAEDAGRAESGEKNEDGEAR
jgi:hypothetical protein